MVVRACVYCRISKDPDGNCLGVSRQEADCRAIAERKGWEVVAVFVDDDISAYDPRRKRPAYNQMLAGIEAGLFDAVIVWDEDRLVRQPKELEHFVDVCEAAGLRHLVAASNESDLSNADDLFLLRMKGIVAKKYSDDNSRRGRRKHLELAEAGRWSGGPRPFGYDLERDMLGGSLGNGRLVPVPGEAEVIVEAAQRVLAGETLYSICKNLNERGVSPVRGSAWRVPSLRGVLTNWTTAGKRVRDGEVVRDALWPASLDEVTHRRLRQRLAAPGAAAPARVALLAGGLLRCAKCGAALHTQRRQGGRRVYACVPSPAKSGCGGIQIAAEPLEELVTAAVFIRLDSPELRRRLSQPKPSQNPATIQADLAALQARKDDLADLFAQGEIDRREWLRARKPLQAAITTAERRLARESGPVSRHAGHGGALAEAWPSMSLGQRRAVVDAVIDHIDVRPAARRGSIDDRIDVHFVI